ncbi:transmembrane protein 134-like [Diadema antillarum]|uniref:transmembrane protein 134-like n=1 Tax=Diadema antillarum TaxID=105358 RepID=UPI003A889495
MSTPLIDPTAPDQSTGTFTEEGVDDSQPDEQSLWWFQRKDVREYRSSLLVSVILLVLGSALLFAGIILEIGQRDHAAGIVCIVAGFLMFVPGLYYTGYAYFAAKGFEGFQLSNLKYFKLSK